MRAGEAGGRVGAAAQAACRHRTLLRRLLAGARADRTLNMRYMVVTPEVSQLDMSALNWAKPEKSSDMSVTAETSQ